AGAPRAGGAARAPARMRRRRAPVGRRRGVLRLRRALLDPLPGGLGGDGRPQARRAARRRGRPDLGRRRPPAPARRAGGATGRRLPPLRPPGDAPPRGDRRMSPPGGAPHPGYRPSAYAEASARILREDPAMRAAVTGAARAKDERRRAAWSVIDADAWRDWARDLKSHVLTHLDTYLEEAEDRLTENGARVHWAETADDACAVVASIARRTGARRVVKAKSMLTEEIALNAHLGALGLEVRETDLGEFIIQLLGEPPSHIVGPSLHRSLEDCRRLFHERFGTPRDAPPEALAATARRVLRDDFLRADLGVSGANFLVAETGTVALIENEGNIRICTSIPRVHVALVGIEKL